MWFDHWLWKLQDEKQDALGYSVMRNDRKHFLIDRNYFLKTEFTVFNIWSTDRKECHSGRGRGVDNPAIKMEQKHLSEDR